MLKIYYERRTGKSSTGKIRSLTLAVFVALGFVLPTSADVFTREDIVNTATALIGSKYKWGGESPETGFDCSGLVFYVFGQCGKTIARTVSGQYSESRQVLENDLEPGDLVFFAINHSYVDHVGVYIGDRDFIQSGESTGVHRDSLDSKYWNKYFKGARTYF